MILSTLVTSQLHFEMCAGLYGHSVLSVVDASFSRVLLIAIVVGLLRLFTKKSKLAIKINDIVYHIKLVLDQKAQPDSCIRCTTL